MEGGSGASSLWNFYEYYKTLLGLIARSKTYSTWPLALALVRDSPLSISVCRLTRRVLGGLIILSLFIRRWDVKYCAQMFDTLTQQFFRRRRGGREGFFQHLRHIFKCWLLDGYYDVRALEGSLKEHFGLEQRMFDYTGNVSSTKVAVTATTISDASTYLFSTYNCSAVRSRDCGKYGDVEYFVYRLTRIRLQTFTS